MQPLRMTMHLQKSTKLEDIPEGPPVDASLRERCRNVHDFYCKNAPNYVLKGVYYPKTLQELHEILKDT